MSTAPPLDPQLIDQARHDVRALVHEIAELSQRELPTRDYFRQFLPRVVTALGATGGVVWLRDQEGLAAECRVGVDDQDLGQEGDDRRRHARLLHQLLSEGEPTFVPPYTSGSDASDSGNPTSHLLLIAPLITHKEHLGLIEIFQRPAASAVAVKGFLRFLAQTAELAGGFLARHQLREFSDRQSLWSQWSEFCRAVHGSLHPRQAAMILANEGRRLLQCDRLSVLLPQGRTFRLAAVSGQELLDERSRAVKHLERLGRAVAAAGEPLWSYGDGDDLPPQLEDAVHRYADESHAKTLAVLPLEKPRPEQRNAKPNQSPPPAETIGLLVIEQFEGAAERGRLEERAAMVRDHGAQALANALEHNDIFLLPLWKGLSQLRWFRSARNLSRTAIVCLIVSCVAVGLAVIPGDFALEAKGTLQPAERHEVFAGSDGEVVAVHVKHAQQVAQGELLAELRDAELDIRLTELRGRRASTQERLNAVDTALLGEKKLTEFERSRLHGERQQAKQMLTSIDEQIRLVDLKRQDLKVLSPSAGEVLTWDVQERLLRRPVKRGDALITVANPQGPWILEVRMPEHRMGHVARAERQSAEPLSVEYILATEPGVTHRGRVEEIHQVAAAREDGNAVTIRVRLDEQVNQQTMSGLRPGAEVTARVACGTRPIGYVWFHDLLAFVQSKILFRL